MKHCLNRPLYFGCEAVILNGLSKSRQTGKILQLRPRPVQSMAFSMSNLFAKQRIIAQPGYSRWLVPPASIAIHLCIGSVYAWSNFNAPLTKVQGVVASAPADWTLGQVVWIFTVAIVFLGLSAAFAGKWLEHVGPRTVGTVAAICWGGGFLLGSLGIWWHQLWLL